MDSMLRRFSGILTAFLILMTVPTNPSQAETPRDRPMIVAHRGFSGLAPENTLAAVNLAWEANADAVEVDVYLTKDNQVICLHDVDTERVAAGHIKLIPGEATYEELAALDVGSWKDEKYRGEKIPLLSEVIATIPEGKTLFVESKEGSDIVRELKRVIEASGKQDQITIISFNKGCLDEVVVAMPGIETKWLLGAPRDERSGTYLPIDPAYAPLAEQFGFGGLNVSYAGVSPDLVEACQMAETDLYIWTLDDPRKARELVEMGVAGITTNRPDVMLEEFGGEQKAGNGE